MIYRELHLSREVRDLLDQALDRRALAFHLSAQHYEAIEAVVDAWDKATVEVEVAETA